MKKYWTEEKIKIAKYNSLLDQLMYYEKEIALVREDAQIQILRLEKRVAELLKINESHQKLNGELREDNKKLARQIDDYVNKLRKAGVI